MQPRVVGGGLLAVTLAQVTLLHGELDGATGSSWGRTLWNHAAFASSDDQTVGGVGADADESDLGGPETSVTVSEVASAAQSCGSGNGGQAQLRVLFTNSGSVQRVDLLDAPTDQEVSQCLVQHFQTLKIPAYRGKQRAVIKTVALP